MSLATVFKDANIVGFCSGNEMVLQAEIRVKMAQAVQAIAVKLVTEVAAYQLIIQQAVLREVCGMVDPHKFAFVSNEGKLNEVMADGLRGFGTEATSSKCADLSGKKGWEPTLVLVDTFGIHVLDQFIQIATSVEKDNCDCIVGDSTGSNEGKRALFEELPQSAKAFVNEAPTQLTIVGNRATSDDDPCPENGSVQKTDGIANWVLTAAKGKEQDDDDSDEEDDEDDDDYEEEAEDDNDNKIEPSDNEEDVEGEDEEGGGDDEEDVEGDDEEAVEGEDEEGDGDDEEDVEGEDEEGDNEVGEEDGDDDGEAEDNGEGQDDDGRERARHQPNMVYRGDTREPDEIFKDGFKSRGGDEELLKHVKGGEDLLKSGYISTSQSLRTPAAFLTLTGESYIDPRDIEIKYDRRVGWVYYINTTGLDMSYVPDLLPTQKEKDKYGYQHEWAIKGTIPGKNIMLAQHVDGYIKRYSNLSNMKQGVDPIFPPEMPTPYKEKKFNPNYGF